MFLHRDVFTWAIILGSCAYYMCSWVMSTLCTASTHHYWRKLLYSHREKPGLNIIYMITVIKHRMIRFLYICHIIIYMHVNLVVIVWISESEVRELEVIE